MKKSELVTVTHNGVTFQCTFEQALALSQPSAAAPVKAARALTFVQYPERALGAPKVKAPGAPTTAQAFAAAVASGMSARSLALSARGTRAAHGVSAATFAEVGDALASLKPTAAAAWRSFVASLT